MEKEVKKVLLLLANGFEIYEASVFIDVFGWNMVDGDGTTKVVVCGLQKQVYSTFGVTLIADITVDELDIMEYDALAIPGGFVEYNYYDQAYSDQFLNIIRQFNKCSKPVASICTGGLPVGKSGVLNNRKGTTYNKKAGIRQRTLASYGVLVVNEPIVEDSNVITSWNPSTAMDVAFRLLEKLTSRTQAEFIKEIMGFPNQYESH